MRKFSIRQSLIERLVFVLAIIGLAGAVAAYMLGLQYANLAYDRALLDDVETLADQITLHDGTLRVNLPPEAQKWLLADEGEQVIWQIIDLANGKTVDSNGRLAGWSDEEYGTGEPHFRDINIGTSKYRVAYIRKVIDPTDHPVLIEIGETLGKRARMASSILVTTIAMMMAMVMIAAVLIWNGVLNALAPLRVLESEAAKRSGTNLMPLQPELAPEEVRGLILSINSMMRRLAGSIEAQRRFTANAAHQLRTPIAGLKLQAQIVLRQKLDAVTRQHLLQIESEAERVGHLIDQLLTLSKVESDGFALSCTSIDLAKISLTTIERYLPQAIAKGIDLGYEGCSEGVFVSGNEVLLTEMLSNLVDNAIRYTSNNGKVTVATETAAHEVKVSVTDTGPGISGMEQDKLFMRLYRSDSSLQTEGAGLGLAIVKEIADRYGAKVTINSVIGQGSCFQVCFP